MVDVRPADDADTLDLAEVVVRYVDLVLALAADAGSASTTPSPTGDARVAA